MMVGPARDRSTLEEEYRSSKKVWSLGLTRSKARHELEDGDACWRHENGTYWPKLLGTDEELTSVGIYVFTYKTGVFSGTYRLGNVVDALKEHLRLDEVLQRQKSVVFVCHSMGGIVARKFLVQQATDLIDRRIEVGLFLIASPSLGSDYANWLAPIAKWFKHSQADALRFSQTNAWLMDLDQEFQTLKEASRLTLHGKELVEDKFVVFSKLLHKQVVEPFAGARYFGDPYKVPDTDHFSICKVADSEAVQHRLLRRFVLEFLARRQAQKVEIKPHRGRLIRSERFEASVESEHAGNLLKYRIQHRGNFLSFSDVFDLWERDPEFVDFYISVLKQSGYHAFLWETPAVSVESVHREFEFVLHNMPRASGRPDRDTYAAYFDTETAPDGIVAFLNLGRDALLIVPSPYREDADYSGLAEFFREAPITQQRALWRELGGHSKSRLSDRPMWLSVAGGGIYWLHLRLDSTPKYYRYQPYTAPR